MVNLWQGFIGGNLANIGDVIECGSVTQFEVLRVKKCKATNDWLYTLRNTRSKKIINYVPEIELSKINGVDLL